MIIKNKNETTRILRVSFTDAQILELGRNLAETHNENTQIETDFQRIKDEFKSKLSAVEARKIDLANKVSSGYEMKPVRCVWTMDHPKPGKKTLYRFDIPDDQKPIEVIETADMTDAEKTPELALGLDNPVLPAGTGISHDGNVKLESDGPAEPGEGKK